MAQNKSTSFITHLKASASHTVVHSWVILLLWLPSKCLLMSVCQREGTLGDDDSADMDGESGRGFEEYEWAGQKRIRATALLEGGFRGKNQRK